MTSVKELKEAVGELLVFIEEVLLKGGVMDGYQMIRWNEIKTKFQTRKQREDEESRAW